MERKFDLSFEELYWVCTVLGTKATSQEHGNIIEKFFNELKKGDQ